LVFSSKVKSESDGISIQHDLNTDASQEVNYFLKERHSCSDMLKFHLEKTQMRQEHYVDKNMIDRVFQVGEEVFLKL
jgi:hypothetical protein